MTSVIIKDAVGDVGRGNTAVVTDSSSPVTIVDANGNVIDTLRPTSVENGQYKHISTHSITGYPPGSKVRIGGQDFAFNPTGGRQEVGDTKAGSTSGNGGPSNLQPTGPNGTVPAFLGGQFPQFHPVGFNPIAVNYNMTDPQQYAEQYGNFARDQYLKNFGMSKQLALQQLDTELQGLKTFAPAAAALKRQQTSLDNLFNQTQRTAQLRAVEPGVLKNLAGQTERAGVYAQGRFISDIEDRALETGLRSASADQTRARGFGDNSIAGRKASDLLSAEQRFQIAQYGEGLITNNAQTRTAIEVAPTQYSDAGSQVRVMPEIGAGRAQAAYTGELTQFSGVSATNALQSKVQQEQFSSDLDYRVQSFNSEGLFRADTFNSSNQFTRDLGLFNYNQGFANTVAGLNQADVNRANADAARADLLRIFNENKGNQQFQNFFQGLIGLFGKFIGTDAFNSILNSIGIPTGKDKPTTTSTGTGPTGNGSGTTRDDGGFALGPKPKNPPDDGKTPAQPPPRPGTNDDFSSGTGNNDASTYAAFANAFIDAYNAIFGGGGGGGGGDNPGFT